MEVIGLVAAAEVYIPSGRSGLRFVCFVSLFFFFPFAFHFLFSLFLSIV